MAAPWRPVPPSIRPSAVELDALACTLQSQRSLSKLMSTMHALLSNSGSGDVKRWFEEKSTAKGSCEHRDYHPELTQEPEEGSSRF